MGVNDIYTKGVNVSCKGKEYSWVPLFYCSATRMQLNKSIMEHFKGLCDCLVSNTCVMILTVAQH